MSKELTIEDIKKAKDILNKAKVPTDNMYYYFHYKGKEYRGMLDSKGDIVEVGDIV